MENEGRQLQGRTQKKVPHDGRELWAHCRETAARYSPGVYRGYHGKCAVCNDHKLDDGEGDIPKLSVRCELEQLLLEFLSKDSPWPGLSNAPPRNRAT